MKKIYLVVGLLALSISASAAGLKLQMASNIETVGSSVRQIGNDFYTFRYIVSKIDIYPEIKLEIFNVTGGEGEPIITHVNAVNDVMFVTQFNYGEAQVEKIGFEGNTLEFNLSGGHKCVLDFGKNMENLGQNFSEASKIKAVCK